MDFQHGQGQRGTGVVQIKDRRINSLKAGDLTKAAMSDEEKNDGEKRGLSWGKCLLPFPEIFPDSRKIVPLTELERNRGRTAG